MFELQPWGLGKRGIRKSNLFQTKAAFLVNTHKKNHLRHCLTFRIKAWLADLWVIKEHTSDLGSGPVCLYNMVFAFSVVCELKQ